MDEYRDRESIARRARDLLPEEAAVGSDDPVAQAAVILDESDRREHLPAPDGVLEHRTSAEAS